MVDELDRLHRGKIKYVRNVPPLRQNLNIDTLFKRASGDRLVLLHDDDLLLPNALEYLSSCWDKYPNLTAAFGLQKVINMHGDVLDEETRITNEFYLRTLDNAGLLKVPSLAGILRMLPNNGYMALTKHAQRIGYRPWHEVGGACEYDFGLRFCLDNAQLCFVDHYVSAYRLSDDAMRLGSNDAPDVLKILKQTTVPPAAEAGNRIAIEHFTPAAVSGFARKGDGSSALKLLISKDYPFKDRFSAKFVFHTLLTLAALLRGKQGAAYVLRKLRGRVRQ
jgi:glycosyltransferase involved in cell wall biosynthesis